MKKIKVTEKGYYDTQGEKWRLLNVGDILEISEFYFPAPCRSKEGSGVWATCGVFVEDENFIYIDN